MRLYSTFLKADASIDRSACMTEAWRLARHRIANDRIPAGSLRWYVGDALREINHKAGIARRVVIVAQIEARVAMGYIEVDRSREWDAAGVRVAA